MAGNDGILKQMGDRRPLRTRPTTWELVGAQMTTDVLPRKKKLRLLNASHQALCYIGCYLDISSCTRPWLIATIQTLVEK